MKEIWKEVGLFDGRYKVSNKGGVRSCDMVCNNYKSNTGLSFQKGRILKQQIDKRGYLKVSLSKSVGGVRTKKTITIHRLVAIAFIPNPDNKPQVNHIDGDKTNNYYMNLEWCTNSENMRHAFNTGAFKNRKGSIVGTSKLVEEEVVQIKKLKGNMKTMDIAKYFNVSISTISAIHHERNWKHIKIKQEVI